jgi:hypothetical protein
MLLIPKEIINKYKNIQETIHKDLHEAGELHARLKARRHSTKDKNDIKIIDEQLSPLNYKITELSSKSSILRQFIHEIELYATEVKYENNKI